MAIVTRTFVAAFVSGSNPATGLAPLPTITIRRVDTGAVIAGSPFTSTEVGDGWYKYDYTSFDTEVGYVATWNGGTSLLAFERNFFGATEAEPPESVAENILDTALGSHLTNGTVGAAIAEATSDGVWVASVTYGGQAGTAWPIGTQGSPVSNSFDAMSIALARGLKTIYVIDSFDLSVDLKGYRVIGVGNNIFTGGELGLSNFDVDGTIFQNLHIRSGGHQGTLKAVDCRVRSTVIPPGQKGSFDLLRCRLRGTFQFNQAETEGSYFHLCSVDDISEGTSPIIDFDGEEPNVRITQFSGPLRVRNMTPGSAGAPSLHVGFVDGLLDLDASNTGGFIEVYGNPQLNDDSDGTAVTRYDVEEFVEARLATDHGAGQWDDTAVVDVDAIADAVLSELVSDHQGVPGSLAEVLAIIKGLGRENFQLENAVYTTEGVMTSAEFRIWDDAANVGTGTGVLATYDITAVEGAPGRTIVYKSVKRP